MWIIPFRIAFVLLVLGPDTAMKPVSILQNSQEPWSPVVRIIYYSITASSSSNLDSSPRSRLSRIRIKPLVVVIHTGWLLPWVASHRHGLSLPNLRLVARSSVVCIRLNSGFRESPEAHLCMRQWPLQVSRSRLLRHLTRLKSLTRRSRSVFGVLPRAISMTLSRSLTEFTWNLAPLLDSRLSSR